MLRVGIIGWRGMVGSVLLQRMHEENDFDKIDTYFFSTSQAGEKVHVLKSQESTLHNALDVHELREWIFYYHVKGEIIQRKFYLY